MPFRRLAVTEPTIYRRCRGSPCAKSVTNDSIKEKVLEIVAEKTGYPKDMLDLDLDLEADLGVDTVKQAEMFAAIRAAYNIPRDENLKLREFPNPGPRDQVRARAIGCAQNCFVYERSTRAEKVANLRESRAPIPPEAATGLASLRRRQSDSTPRSDSRPAPAASSANRPVSR